MVDLSKFKELFVSETEDHLQKLNDNLLALEKTLSTKKQSDPRVQGLLDELMRSSHTIKGSAATMEYKKMALLAHIMEDVFDYTRNSIIAITPKVINELFKTFDILGKSLNTIEKSGEEPNVNLAAQRLKKLTGVKTTGTGKSPRSKSGKPIASKTQRRPDADKISDEISVLDQREDQRVSHIKVPVKRLDDLVDLMGELLIDRMKLEQIVQSGSRFQVSGSSKQEKNLDPNPYNLEPKQTELAGVVGHLSRLVSDLQYNVMQARLVPVDQIFARFPRMIRDLARAQKKKINLEITGGGLELDRTIVDKLGEPLMHLINNAADHGVAKNGSIKIRAMREKDFALISVENDKNVINWQSVIEAAVRRKIINKDRGDKLLSNQQPATSNEYKEKELEELLFHPRLSTKEKITETSGRGVGMSVVKSFTEQVGGRVIVESPIQSGSRFQVAGSGGKKDSLDPSPYNLEPKSGTRFTLELPITLALVNALLVGVRDRVFAIPFANIDRSLQVPKLKIKNKENHDVAAVNGTNIPLVRLDKVFNISNQQPVTSNEYKEKELPVTGYPLPARNASRSDAGGPVAETVVLIKRGKDTAGVVVDELVDEKEIIVKTLPPILSKVKGFSGSTILGDGKTILILDVPSLLESAKRTNT